MATIVTSINEGQRSSDLLTGTPRAHALDRWIFVLTSAWFIVVVLIGFVPDSIHQIARVQSGDRPPFPLIMHVHAVLMGSYLALLLAQTWFMATGRAEYHMQLGLVAIVLAPTLVVVGFLLAPAIYHQGVDAWRSAAPAARERLHLAVLRRENVLLLQMRTGLLFSVFTTIGLLARARNSGLHKRMMILAPAIALPAAVDRITWLPTTYPENLLTVDIYTVLAISPMLIWDLMRNRNVHPAYWIVLGLTVPATLVVYGLWNTPSWHGAARAIMGG